MGEFKDHAGARQVAQIETAQSVTFNGQDIEVNSEGPTPPEVLKGIQHVIAAIRQEQPQARIILMAIFPREQSPKDPLRLKVQETNELLIAKAKDWNVDVLDIGAQLVEEDGSISKEMMGDFVHLTDKGYQIWAGAVIAALKETKSSKL